MDSLAPRSYGPAVDRLVSPPRPSELGPGRPTRPCAVSSRRFRPKACSRRVRCMIFRRRPLAWPASGCITTFSMNRMR